MVLKFTLLLLSVITRHFPDLPFAPLLLLLLLLLLLPPVPGEDDYQVHLAVTLYQDKERLDHGVHGI
jgi:hypothetical protein